MSGLPEITMTGTLVEDPVLKYSQAGTALVHLNIACNDRRYNTDTGGWENSDTTFLRATAWKQLAEHAAESLAKGHRVTVTGALQQRRWETNTGETRQAYQVDVTDLAASLRFNTLTIHQGSRHRRPAPPKPAKARAFRAEPDWPLSARCRPSARRADSTPTATRRR